MCAAFVAVAGPALAQPSPSPSPSGSPAPLEVPEAVPGEQQCATDDYRLPALSGLVALDDGYAVVNDGNSKIVAYEAMAVHLLDQDCQIQQSIPLPLMRDPEDLALDREDQVLWVADTGDNFQDTGEQERPNVALWRIELSGDRVPVIYRFSYPDGAKDAEALILDGDGTPIIVSREVGTARLYRPDGELTPSQGPQDTVPLEQVGEFSPPDTGTPHALGRLARQVVTGGANSPDGSRVVLRTLTDAFEFEVTDGDVVAAISSAEPTITPLPDEPQGEAIDYSPDGEYFLTVSDTYFFEGVTPVILRYTPAEPPPEPTPTAVAAQEPAPDNRSLLDRLGFQGIINIVIGVGIVGLLMVAAGIVGIVRARRRAAEEGDPEEAAAPVTARARVAPPPPDPQQGWEPHPDEDYRDGAGAGYPPHGGLDPAHGGVAGAPPGGTVYSAGGSYREEPFDQDYPNGYPDGGYAGQPPAHPAEGQPGVYRAPPPEPAGGTYSGGVYQSRQDDVPDYYSDDPDYPYEFRDRDRW